MKRILIIGLLAITITAQAQKIEWPEHKKAVIVPTYDDALLSQLDNAVPQLQEAGFKATFFLTADLNYNTIPRWRALSQQGFELGNHTIFHPCLPGEDNPVSSANYTPYAMMREIDYMHDFLLRSTAKCGGLLPILVPKRWREERITSIRCVNMACPAMHVQAGHQRGDHRF